MPVSSSEVGEDKCLFIDDNEHHCLFKQIIDKEEILNPEDFRDLSEIGYGNGGIVFKSLHVPSKLIVARKLFNSRISSASKRKMLQQELMTLKRCCSPFILHYYGSIVAEFQVSLVLEYMDLGSLSDITRTLGPLDEKIIGKICWHVLMGLDYLHANLNIIHRDLKPSNILVNSKGQVKLCDFGDSVEMINSQAKSVVGTMGYMAPERIQGHCYSSTSDVWSLGVTLIELATGLFPFSPVEDAESITRGLSARSRSSGGLDNMAIVELLEAISYNDPPKLHPHLYSSEFINLVTSCLSRNPDERPTPNDLLMHPFVEKYKEASLKEWAQQISQDLHNNPERINTNDGD